MSYFLSYISNKDHMFPVVMVITSNKKRTAVSSDLDNSLSHLSCVGQFEVGLLKRLYWEVIKRLFRNIDSCFIYILEQ